MGDLNQLVDNYVAALRAFEETKKQNNVAVSKKAAQQLNNTYMALVPTGVPVPSNKTFFESAANLESLRTFYNNKKVLSPQVSIAFNKMIDGISDVLFPTFVIMQVQETPVPVPVKRTISKVQNKSSKAEYSNDDDSYKGDDEKDYLDEEDEEDNDFVIVIPENRVQLKVEPVVAKNNEMKKEDEPEVAATFESAKKAYLNILNNLWLAKKQILAQQKKIEKVFIEAEQLAPFATPLAKFADIPALQLELEADEILTSLAEQFTATTQKISEAQGADNTRHFNTLKLMTEIGDIIGGPNALLTKTQQLEKVEAHPVKKRNYTKAIAVLTGLALIGFGVAFTLGTWGVGTPAGAACIAGGAAIIAVAFGYKPAVRKLNALNSYIQSKTVTPKLQVVEQQQQGKDKSDVIDITADKNDSNQKKRTGMFGRIAAKSSKN